MGTLRNVETRERATLASPTVVGRAARSGLVIRQPRVSAQHATFFFDDGWFVRDLGSRNGTFVGERRLSVGIRAEVPEGTTVRFAEEAWILEYGGPPRPRLLDPATGQRTEAEGDLLVLPSPDDPQLTIYRRDDQGWIAEFATEARSVVDGESVDLSGRRWIVELPAAHTRRVSTTVGDERVPDSLLAVKRLTLEVSMDEESVVTTLSFPNTQVQLKPRSFHYLVLTLARARLADREGGAPPSETGWRYADEVAGWLDIDVTRLNVEVYRLRQQLAGLGLRDAATIIERRPQAGQMRLGVGQLDVRVGG